MGSLFDPCVNAMGWRPCWPSHTEASYYTSGFGVIIQRDLRTWLQHDSQPDNLCLRDLSPRGKGNSRLMKLLGGLSYEARGSITHRGANSSKLTRVKVDVNRYIYCTVQWQNLILMPRCYVNHCANWFSDSPRICSPELSSKRDGKMAATRDSPFKFPW